METSFPVTVTYSARGVPTYRSEVSHDGLHKYTVMRAGDPDILAKKVLAQALQWNAAWEKLSALEQAQRLVASRKEIAIERTTEAQRLLETLRNTLIGGIELDPTLDWEQLKVRTPFSVSGPKKPDVGPEPALRPAPPAPKRSDYKYQVKLSLLDRLLAPRKEIKLADAENRFDADMNTWRNICAGLSVERASELEAHQAKSARPQEEYVRALAKWKDDKTAYQEEQEKQHADVDQMCARYESKSPAAVIEYCERVLSNSDYPECIPREFDFDLNK